MFCLFLLLFIFLFSFFRVSFFGFLVSFSLFPFSIFTFFLRFSFFVIPFFCVPRSFSFFPFFLFSLLLFFSLFFCCSLSFNRKQWLESEYSRVKEIFPHSSWILHLEFAKQRKVADVLETKDWTFSNQWTYDIEGGRRGRKNILNICKKYTNEREQSSSK